jgi:hypothetical protein
VSAVPKSIAPWLRGRGQKAEDRGQRTEDRGQRTEDRNLKPFFRNPEPLLHQSKFENVAARPDFLQSVTEASGFWK